MELEKKNVDFRKSLSTIMVFRNGRWEHYSNIPTSGFQHMMVASQFTGDCGLTTLSLVSLTVNETVVILKQARFSQAVPSSVFSFGTGGWGGCEGRGALAWVCRLFES